MPARVQLSRKKGWRMPPNTVSVARPGPHGNPWYVGPGQVRLTSGEKVSIPPILTAAGVVDRFRRWHAGEFGFQIGPHDHRLYGLVMCPGSPPRLDGLRGKNLACWCPLDQPCHADVLLELANHPTESEQEL